MGVREESRSALLGIVGRGCGGPFTHRCDSSLGQVATDADAEADPGMRDGGYR